MLGLVHVGSRALWAGFKPANLCLTRWLGSKESYHVNAVFNSKYHRSAHEILCLYVFTYAVHGGTLKKESTERVPTHVQRRWPRPSSLVRALRPSGSPTQSAELGGRTPQSSRSRSLQPKERIRGQ